MHIRRDVYHIELHWDEACVRYVRTDAGVIYRLPKA